MNIGIIGQGFVGNAVFQKFRKYYNVYTYDLQAKLCNATNEEIFVECDIIFVCLPTPMNKDGSCYTGLVEAELRDLDEKCRFDSNKKKTIIIKSTISPGTFRVFLNKSYLIRIFLNLEISSLTKNLLYISQVSFFDFINLCIYNIC